MGIVVEREAVDGCSSLPLLSLNHVSFVCKSVSRSVRFYEEVLGFVLIKRPSSFKFEGACTKDFPKSRIKLVTGEKLLDLLFNYGIGIHLLECDSPNSSIPDKKEVINPKDNHISFQCSDMRVLMKKLEEMGIEYVTAVVEEGGVQVDQLFFHDPDGYMIEICNCENLPVLPLSSCPLKRQLGNYAKDLDLPSLYSKFFRHSPLDFCLLGLFGNQVSKARCVRGMESSLMENLAADMIYISY
ncbi:hypothetical protein ACLOJK_033177 [Asimina triloba]